jgi:hypothetical protein
MVKNMVFLRIGDSRVSQGASVLGSVNTTEGELTIGGGLSGGGCEEDSNDCLSDGPLGVKVAGDGGDSSRRFVGQSSLSQIKRTDANRYSVSEILK